MTTLQDYIIVELPDYGLMWKCIMKSFHQVVIDVIVLVTMQAIKQKGPKRRIFA